MPNHSNSPKVYVVIVNYQSWSDTVECLESVFRNVYPNYQVVVVDNSEDEESIQNLKLWAEGKTSCHVSDTCLLKHLSDPPISKPIHYIIRDETEEKYRFEDPSNDSKASPSHPSLIVIRSGKNLGFAGGNNLGIKYAVDCNDYDFVLLLNNDTVVEKDFIFPLVETYKLKSNVGLVGGLIKVYDKPSEIWFSSGRFHWYREGVHLTQITDSADIINSDFVSGCLMMIPRYMIEIAGVLSEDYFLYGEDTDYSLRVLRAGYKNFDNHKCVVYHKISKSTGGRFSKIMYHYSTRNRLYFHYKYYGRLDFFFFALLFLSSKSIRILQFLSSGNKEARDAMVSGIVGFFKIKKRWPKSRGQSK